MTTIKNQRKEIEKIKQQIFPAGQRGKNHIRGKTERILQKDYVMNTLEREIILQKVNQIIIEFSKMEIEDMNKGGAKWIIIL